MKKTAIMEAIEVLGAEKDKLIGRLDNVSPIVSNSINTKILALKKAINILQSLLPKEREQIEAAYWQGCSDAEWRPSKQSASDYYTTNYSQDKKETNGKD